jgi:hypothetical protein
MTSAPYVPTSVVLAQSKATNLLAETIILNMERDYCVAMVMKNVKLLDTLLSDDFTIVASDGTTGGKAGMLDIARSGDADTCSNEDMKVRVYNNAAIVTGRLVYGSSKARPSIRDRQVMFTDTFIRRGDRWQAVSSHATLIAPPPKK